MSSGGIRITARCGKESGDYFRLRWKTLFGAKPDLYLYALILLLFAGIYSFEYKSGMDGLLPSVKRGDMYLTAQNF